LEFLHAWHSGNFVSLPESFIPWARGQRLLPLLLWRSQQQQWDLSSAIITAARQEHYHVMARQMMALAQLQLLAQIAHTLAHKIVIVKGHTIAITYPEPTQRPYGDIDILVSTEGQDALVRALQTHGYRFTENVSRSYHLPPLYPPNQGLRVEIHTALGRSIDARTEHPCFTFAEWATRLQPWAMFPGLWQPDVVDHAAYLIYHEVGVHQLQQGLLSLADIKFWTAEWELAQWQTLQTRVSAYGLERMTGLVLALVAWFWDTPWPESVRMCFPTPDAAMLATAQQMITGELLHTMPNLWRDLPERSLRGWLSYLSIILLGAPAVRRNLTWQQRLTFYLKRPVNLVKNHAPSLWRLFRGDRRARRAWQAQRQLQDWLAEK